MDIITRETDPPPWAICLLFDLCNIAQPFQQQLSSCSICEGKNLLDIMMRYFGCYRYGQSNVWMKDVSRI